MATTTKTLTPTNQTITLPDMTERPDASVLVDGIGKDADAINALSDQMEPLSVTVTKSEYVSSNSAVSCVKVGKIVIVNININILSTMPDSGVIASGLPLPNGLVAGALVKIGASLPIVVSNTGVLRFDTAIGGVAGWVNGNLVYTTT